MVVYATVQGGRIVKVTHGAPVQERDRTWTSKLGQLALNPPRHGRRPERTHLTVRRQEVWKFGGTSVDDAEKRRAIGMKVTRTRDKDVVVVGLHPAATNASSS